MSVKYIHPYTSLFIVKLGYAGLYLFFLFLLQNIDCGYSLEPPRRAKKKKKKKKEREKYQNS